MRSSGSKRLAAQVLSLARAEEPVAADEPCDLAGIVEAVVADGRYEAAAKDICLDYQSPAGALVVRGDPGSLSSAVENVLRNAVQNTPAGGTVTVSISASPGATVVVTDSGPGVPDVELERIFEPFYRIDTNRPGSGIGLAIAERAVRRAGGAIEARKPIRRRTRSHAAIPDARRGIIASTARGTPAAAPATPWPMTDELTRYHRQMLLPGFGEAGQRRLLRSTVAVLGCGALGSAAADMLARAGVGHLIIIDRDFVELTNLQRQVLFDEQDVATGMPKAEAARRKLAGINSGIEVTAIVDDLNHANIERYTRGADVLVDGPRQLRDPLPRQRPRGEIAHDRISTEEQSRRREWPLQSFPTTMTRPPRRVFVACSTTTHPVATRPATRSVSSGRPFR